MKLVALLCALAICLVGVASEEAEVDEKDVVVLTDATFDAVIKENPFVLVEFYAPWCGHCKHLVPVYAEVATALKGETVLAKLDATVEKESAAKYDIKGFPTIKFFRDGSSIEYTGDRTVAGMTAWIKKKTGPVTLPLATNDAIISFVADKVAVVGFFSGVDSDEYKAFTKAAKSEQLDSFPFGEVTDAALHGERTVPSVVVYRPFGEPIAFTDFASGASIESFVMSNGFPLVDEVTPVSFRRFMEQGFPLGILFLDTKDAEAKKDLIALVTTVAEKVQGKFNFGWSDGIQYKRQLERMGGSGEKLPTIAVMTPETSMHYPYDETKDLTLELVQTWVDGILAGTVEPFLKSEAIPADNNGPVVTVVGKNFDAIVNDATKDVLLEIYAPWCGHCKQLAPIYEELGQAFTGDSSVVIAKCDGTLNDIPGVQVKGFPTIKFFPANNKKAPVDYEGARTLEAMSEFIKAHQAAASSEEVPVAEAAVEAESKDEL